MFYVVSGTCSSFFLLGINPCCYTSNLSAIRLPNLYQRFILFSSSKSGFLNHSQLYLLTWFPDYISSHICSWILSLSHIWSHETSIYPENENITKNDFFGTDVQGGHDQAQKWTHWVNKLIEYWTFSIIKNILRLDFFERALKTLFLQAPIGSELGLPWQHALAIKYYEVMQVNALMWDKYLSTEITLVLFTWN